MYNFLIKNEKKLVYLFFLCSFVVRYFSFCKREIFLYKTLKINLLHKMNSTKTSFLDNTEIAFATLSDKELRTSFHLFKLIDNPFLTKVGIGLLNTAIKLRIPVEWAVKPLIFNHFCGGTTEEECIPVIEKMGKSGVSSVLDYAVEGDSDEAGYEATFNKTLQTLDFIKTHRNVAFGVFKPTGFGAIEVYHKLSENKPLTSEEQTQWERIKQRYYKVCERAHALDIPVLIDAEESWIQPAVDSLVEELMASFNKEKAIVYNTLQMYRYDRMPYFEQLLQKAENQGFYIGVKIVRGAYMEKENKRAAEMGYTSPICPNKQATDDNYNAAIKFVGQHIDRISVFAGTHNQDSVLLLTEILKEKNIPTNTTSVFFGQLYGMSDHLSYNLANAKYNVAKYLPFGPVKKTVPYLIRRAQENTSVKGQSGRELTLISQEMKRRGISIF